MVDEGKSNHAVYVAGKIMRVHIGQGTCAEMWNYRDSMDLMTIELK